jgi:hypothetical protein
MPSGGDYGEWGRLSCCSPHFWLSRNPDRVRRAQTGALSGPVAQIGLVATCKWSMTSVMQSA